MDCKSKIYKPDERTLCSTCAKAEGCARKITCAICHGGTLLYYAKRHDAFLCEPCRYKLDVRDEEQKRGHYA